MASAILAIGHTHMLVKCVLNSMTYFKILEPIQIFASLKPGEKYYTFLSDRRVSCEVITSSDDLEEMKVELVNIRAQNALKSNSQISSVASTSTVSENPPIKHLDENKMYTFGPNGTAISAGQIKEMDWSDYKSVTRELICAVFALETLATHTLLGKNSYRLKLDAKKVNDIIYIVTNKCGVSREDVREMIRRRCLKEYKRSKKGVKGVKKFNLGRLNTGNI